MSKNSALLTILITALATVFTLPILPVSHAQNTGTVCIADASSTNCPSTPPSFTGPFQSQQFSVNIQNSDSFNSFDISVKTDAGVLEPYNMDFEGSLIQTGPFTIVSECINGQPIIGSCRIGIDGYGIATLAVAADGFDVQAPASGRLFSIAYRVGFFGVTTPIGFQTGCTGTSNNGFCVTVADGRTGTVVPENLQGASFAFRDFSLGVFSNFQIVSKGTSPTFSVILGTIGDYSGTVSLSATVSPITRHTPVSTFNPASLTLSPGSTPTSILTVTTTRSTTVGRYEIRVTGTDGVLTHSANLILFIETR